MTIRTALIGLGAMGRIHALALAKSGRYDFVAASDPDASRHSTLPSGVAAYEHAANMVRDEGPELVVVATPPALHPEMALAAFEAGAHVLCEKPLAVDSGEARRLVGAAERSGRVAAVNLQLRFSPARLAMRDMIEDSLLGPLVGFRAVLALPGYHEVAPNWYREPRLGGGVLMELGTHVIDQMIWLGGEVESASGVGASITDGPDRGAQSQVHREDHVSATLRFRGGHVGELMVSTVARSEPPRMFEIFGENATLRLTGETGLDLVRPGTGPVSVPIKDDQFQSLIGDPSDSYTQSLQGLYAHLAEVLQRQAAMAPLATFSDALAVQVAIDSIRGHAREDDRE